MPSEEHTAHTTRVWLIWKVPEKHLNTDQYSQVGIYPTGELLAVCETETAAESHREELREHSPSERFGDSMDEAPYRFEISMREVVHEQ